MTHRAGVQEMNDTQWNREHNYKGIQKISNNIVEAIGFYRLWMLPLLLSGSTARTASFFVALASGY